jgi:hypothetical protein
MDRETGLVQGTWTSPVEAHNTISGAGYILATFMTQRAVDYRITVFYIGGNDRHSDAERKYFDFVRASNSGYSVCSPPPLSTACFLHPKAMLERVRNDLEGRMSWMYIQPALSGRFEHFFPVTPNRLVLAADGSYTVKQDPAWSTL